LIAIEDPKLKSQAKKLENKKVRPMNIWKFSKYQEEKEVLFGPLSTFKIDSLPQEEKHESGH
jgi:hypothetical protein